MSLVDKDEKIVRAYEGSYTYLSQGRPYSEENFYVILDHSEQTTTFHSEINSRCPTGEFLKINVRYKISDNHLPLEVEITRKLGSKTSEEKFFCNHKTQKLDYEFECEDDFKNAFYSTPARYHISTPATCVAFYFQLSKKFDPTRRNHYIVLFTQNEWAFNGPPNTRSLYLERKKDDEEKLIINNQELHASKFLIYKTIEPTAHEVPSIFYQSKHLGIPYDVILEENIEIKINYLRHLDKGETIEDRLKNATGQK